METYLQMFCLHRQDDWADLLLTAEFAYNNHHHPLIDTTPFLRIMDITQPLQMCQVLDSLASPTNRSTGSMRHRRSASMQSNDCRRYPNEHTINGRTRTLVSKSEIQFGSKRQTSQQMNLLQSSQASSTAHLRSKTSSQI